MNPEVKKLRNRITADGKDIRHQKWVRIDAWRKYATSRNFRDFSTAWKVDSKLSDMRDAFRHRHIAWCLLRGKMLDQIEPKRKTEPNMDLVKAYMKEIEEQISGE